MSLNHGSFFTIEFSSVILQLRFFSDELPKAYCSSRRKEAPTSFARKRMSLLTSAATKFMVRGRCGRGPCALWCMGREHLQKSDANRGHEPWRSGVSAE